MGAHSNDGITSDAWGSCLVSNCEYTHNSSYKSKANSCASDSIHSRSALSISRPKHSHFCLCLTLRPFVGAREAVLLDLCAAALSARAQVSFLVLLSLGQRDK